MMENSMRRLLMIICGALLGASSLADAQQATNPIASLVGYWDLPGTILKLKIHPDGTVDHSELGEGTIRFDETSYYRLVFRHRHLTCQYQVRKYSENELTFTVSVQPSDSLCELGALRRSPGSPLPDLKGKSSEIPAAGAVTTAEERKDRPEPGTPFKDCEDCPEMIALPTGRFTMGSPDTESGRRDIEGPQRTVEVRSSFAVGRYAVTRDQYESFVKATGRLYEDGCQVEASGKWIVRTELTFRAVGFLQDGRHPVVCVNWDDANAYAKWLSAKTGKSYRLLTEAEREYASRAGTSTAYWWGDAVRPELANFDKTPQTPNPNKTQFASTTATSRVGGPQLGPASGTVPVHLYQPNPWGLYQVHGNVGEWVVDCWNKSYMGAPTDTSAAKAGDCDRRVIRGGGWSYWASDIRSAYRESARKDSRYVHIGFRVARDLN
jgi:formylglycine-generating enzyme required for sulfatase activity